MSAFDFTLDTFQHTQLNDTNVGFTARLVNWNFGNPLDPILNGVGDMRNTIVVSKIPTTSPNTRNLHLDRLSQILSDALTLDDMLVNLSGRDVVVSGECGEEVSFVVSKIEIHF